ncbi:helix-turn-helix transcriptional regulator [Segnochrobactraceae bacterium EtOH-i3]
MTGRDVENQNPDGAHPDAPQLSGVLYKIYAATLSPEGWRGALDSLATLSGSNGSAIYAKTAEGWTFPVYSESMTPALEAYVQEGWAARNPWLQGRREAGFRAGDVYRDLDIVTPEEMETNPFYTDYLHRFGLGRQMVAIIYSELGSPTCLVSHREMSKGPFQPQEMATHLKAARHIEQSLRISCTLMRDRTKHDTVASAFDAMDRPAFVLDEQHRPVMMNRSGREMFDSYFVEDKDRVRPVRPHEAAEFARVVQQAHGADGNGQPLPQPATISDREGNGRLVVWGTPLVGVSADSLGCVKAGRHVLVLAQPLQQDRRVEPTVIRSVYGLTTGEARLASLIGSGCSVVEAAGELGLTEGTTRFVLKRIFRKLDIHRQADLVTKVRQLLL